MTVGTVALRRNITSEYSDIVFWLDCARFDGHRLCTSPVSLLICIDHRLQEFQDWAAEAGFSSTERLPLVGSTAAAIAYK